MELKDLKKKAKTLSVICWVGKSGLTQAAVNEIKSTLKKKKLVKIKLLKSFLQGKDKKKVVNEIAQKTNSQVVQSIGSVVVLYKR